MLRNLHFSYIVQKSRRELDLGPTMPNIKLGQFFFSFTTMYLNFVFLDQFLFELSCKNTWKHGKHGNTHRNTQTHTKTLMSTL